MLRKIEAVCAQSRERKRERRKTAEGGREGERESEREVSQIENLRAVSFGESYNRK